MHWSALQARLPLHPIDSKSRYISLRKSSKHTKNRFSPTADPLELVVSSFKPSSGPHKSSELLRECCKLGRIDLITSLLSKQGSINLPERILTECIQALGRAGEIDAAIRLLRSIHPAPDRIAYSAGIYWLCKSSRMIEAVSLLQEMKASNQMPDIITYNTIIFGFCNSGELDRALEILNSIITEASSCKPNVVTYGTLILALCKRHRAAEALNIFERMIQEQILPDSTIYSTLIDCLCWLRILDRARWVYEKISELECEKNSFIYKKLICSHVKAGQFESAVKFFHLSVEEKIPLELTVVNFLILGLVRSGRYPEALQVFDEVRSTGKFDTFTYNLLLSACSRVADFESAWGIYLEMRRNDCNPDLVTFHTILHTMRRAGRMAEFERVVGEMSSCGVPISEHGVKVIVFGLIRLGLLEKGLEFLREYGDCAGNEACYWLVVWKFCRAKEFEKARGVVVGMRELRVSVCSLLMNKLIDSGREVEFQRLVAELEIEGVDGEVLCELLRKKQRRNILKLMEFL